MSHVRRFGLPWLLVLACWLGWMPSAHALVQEPAAARMLSDASRTPPAASAGWSAVTLPDLWRKSRPKIVPAASWYRIDFQHAPGDSEPWGVLFPYLYEGGQVWLNGALLAGIQESSATSHVRWARPHLVSLPPALLRADNELLVRVQPAPDGSLRFPRVRIGPMHEVAPLHDSHFFWASVTPQITVVICLLTSLSVLYIWWRQRGEVMYGLFGLAVALWGLRTLTFVVEVVPASAWPFWRLLVHSATGGFIVAMTVLAWRLAGVHKPWFERALFGYWLVGPLWMLAQGVGAEPLVNRWWIGGFLPIGATIVAVSVWSLVRQRTIESAALPLTMAIAALAGMHDYLIRWELDPPIPWLEAWFAQRFQLLHLAANLVLLAIGWLLTRRFIGALRSMEDVKHNLEARVADREKELAANYVRVFALERENAAGQERQRIMRDIHDGLGSRLFVSLSRVERGEMTPEEIADSLRGCISEMRLALDTLAPSEHDFRSTLGNFLFRWRGQLLACGIQARWDIDVPDEALQLSPHASLQLLRVAQEALTNVVKHAGASMVDVQLRLVDGKLELEVRDNGIGAAGVSPDSSGRGLTNMRTRATQLGGHVDVHGGSGGTRVTVQVPLHAVCA